MDAHTAIEDWESGPFDGGLDELDRRGFDGAIEVDDAVLFVRDGEPIAVVSDLATDPTPAGSGAIDAFAGAAGRRHTAPDTATATLAAMLALGGEVRGKYFSDDTPLSAVHDTLSGGGFTGYVELSENVLSGDYYYVYVDGEVEHVGYIGSGQRIAGEEAKRKAEDEIGIYAVVAVSLQELSFPESSDGSAANVSGVGSEPGSGSTTDATADSGSRTETEPDPDTNADLTADSDVDSDSNPKPTPESEPEATDPNPETEADADSGRDSSRAPSTAEATDMADSTAEKPDSEARSDSDGTASPGSDTDSPAATGTNTDTGTDTGTTTDTDTDTEHTSATNRRSISSPDPTRNADASAGSDGAGMAGLATRRVPSLDPEQSGTGASGGSSKTADDGNTARTRGATAGTETNTERARGSHDGSDAARSRSRDRHPDADTIERYEQRIEAHEQRIEDLESQLETREAKIETLESELEALRTERDELESELEARETAADDSPRTAGLELPPSEAFAGTSLFVRERTRGENTLSDAHDGQADREAVASNLHIGHHTTFESDEATVEGEPFEAWLRSSDPYAFVEWLVTDLLFEIRSTNATDGLGPLYDALPAIDRIGFEETVPAGSGKEGREVEFDIVARDKKGNPLIVARYDQDRDPTYAETIEPFITDSSDVCETNETLAAGMVVTSSYFEADAMQATEEATSTSLLSRSTYRSYVKLSRSGGFHLCLVEARDGSFNLSVPEL